jgi:hypothetical protein
MGVMYMRKIPQPMYKHLGEIVAATDRKLTVAFAEAIVSITQLSSVRSALVAMGAKPGEGRHIELIITG